LAALVAGPAAPLHRGDAAASQAAFEALLAAARARHGAASVEELDLLSAYGVELFLAGQGRLALQYLEQAVAVARQAVGVRHPETALALHTYAMAFRQVHLFPPPQALAALEEALSIRREVLGPRNVETLAALEDLAKARFDAAMETRDPRVRVEAEALIAELQQLIDQGVALEKNDAAALRHGLAMLAARFGRPAVSPAR
jgi:tetratricopeptide (TPR) repeat protein